MISSPAQAWPNLLVTSTLSDTGIPGVGSYSTLADPLPLTGTPVLDAGIVTNPLTAAAQSIGAQWLTVGGVVLLAVLLLVVGVWVILNG